MSIEVDQQKIRGVQERISQALSTREFHPAEVVFGLAELIGRMIVGYVPGTSIQKQEWVDAVTQHIEDTVRIGVERQQQQTPLS